MPVKVMRAITDYLEAAGRKDKTGSAPLFVGFNKGDHPEEKPISDKLIYRTVMAYANAAEIESLSPHGLRASFVTLALKVELNFNKFSMPPDTPTPEPPNATKNARLTSTTMQ